MQHAPDRNYLSVWDDGRPALAVDRDFERLTGAGVTVGDVRASAADDGTVCPDRRWAGGRDRAVIRDRPVPGGIFDDHLE